MPAKAVCKTNATSISILAVPHFRICRSVRNINPAPASCGGHDQREAQLARLYETVVLVDPNREDAAIEASVQKFTDLITAGGEMIRVDRWGKRRIAYEIAGRTHADYTVYYYHANKNTLVSELERMLRLDESILRFLTVVDNPVGVPPLQQHATEADIPEDADNGDKED